MNIYIYIMNIIYIYICIYIYMYRYIHIYVKYWRYNQQYQWWQWRAIMGWEWWWCLLNNCWSCWVHWGVLQSWWYEYPSHHGCFNTKSWSSMKTGWKLRVAPLKKPPSKPIPWYSHDIPMVPLSQALLIPWSSDPTATLWVFHITVEYCPLIDDFPLKSLHFFGDFPWLCWITR